ncbi:MAG: TolC family protein [Phycisphaerales bacterium]|nr:TolC family protein [Phycisphaerales bacterium]
MRILEELRGEGLIEADAHGVRPGPTVAEQLAFAWPVEGPVGEAEVLAAADRLSPEIAGARARIGVVGGRAWQASFYPNPTLDVESENLRPGNGDFGVSQSTIGLSQPIIVSDRRDAAIASGLAYVSAERLELEATRRRVHGAIRRELREVAYLREAIERHEVLRDIAERTLEIASARFEVRAAPESETIRARVEYNSLGIAIDRLRGDLAVSAERLAAHLGGRGVPLARVVVAPVPRHWSLPPLEELAASVRSTHPAVLAALARVEGAQREVDLERAHRYPDVTARIGVGVDHLDDRGFIEAGVEVPLPILNANEGNILAARFSVIERRERLNAVTSELLGRLGEAYRRWESAAGRLAAFEENVLNDAQRAYDQAKDGYEAGSLAFLDLLDAQRTLTEASIAQVELLRVVSHSLADIHEVVDEPFNHLNATGDAP